MRKFLTFLGIAAAAGTAAVVVAKNKEPIAASLRGLFARIRTFAEERRSLIPAE